MVRVQREASCPADASQLRLGDAGEAPVAAPAPVSALHRDDAATGLGVLDDAEERQGGALGDRVWVSSARSGRSSRPTQRWPRSDSTKTIWAG